MDSPNDQYYWLWSMFKIHWAEIPKTFKSNVVSVSKHLNNDVWTDFKQIEIFSFMVTQVKKAFTKILMLEIYPELLFAFLMRRKIEFEVIIITSNFVKDI